MGTKPTQRQRRVVDRPEPELWRPDELMTLAEAAALFWPHGPLGVSSLRTAIRDGVLSPVRVAGKLLVTPAAIAAMSAGKPKVP